MTPADPVAAARALAPGLAAWARETEARRRLADDTVRELAQAGLFRLLQPARVGGAEAGLGTLLEVCAELGRGCASTAWVTANLASHHWMLAMWPRVAQDEIWGVAGESADVLIAGSLVFPAGRAEPVAGGYRLSGRWNFASGVDFCDWILLGAVVVEDSPGPDADAGEFRLFALPRTACVLGDNWNAAGLSGTGSQRVEVLDALVPAHRAVALRDLQAGRAPGAAVNPGPLYRLPLPSTLGHVLAGVPLGIASSMLDLFEAETGRRLTSYSGRNLADFASVHARVAEASARIDAATRLLHWSCRDLMDHAAAGRDFEPAHRARFRRDAAFATRLNVEAADLIFAAGGGNALYLDHPAQRNFRDIHAAAAHISLNWDAAASIYGRTVLGRGADILPYER